MSRVWGTMRSLVSVLMTRSTTNASSSRQLPACSSRTCPWGTWRSSSWMTARPTALRKLSGVSRRACGCCESPMAASLGVQSCTPSDTREIGRHAGWRRLVGQAEAPSGARNPGRKSRVGIVGHGQFESLLRWPSEWSSSSRARVSSGPLFDPAAELFRHVAGFSAPAR